MKITSGTGSKDFTAVYVAFFSIGLVETLFPRLNWQMSIVFSDDYLVRVLIFVGLVLLSLLSVGFGLLSPGKHIRRNMLIGLLTIIPGLLIPLFFPKSVQGILLRALFLFSGSLFVQVSGIQIVLSNMETRQMFKRIACLYLLKTAGLVAGMSFPFIFPYAFETNGNMGYYLPFVFIGIAVSMLFLLPFARVNPDKHEEPINLSFSIFYSDKLFILLSGGLVLYSGAEFCLNDLFPFYFSETFGLRIMEMGVPGAGLFLISLLAGRFAGFFLCRFNKPVHVLLLSSLLCFIGVSGIFLGQKYISLASTVFTGIGLANIFPVLLSLSLSRIKTNARELTGIMIATIPLGELFISLMWAVTDSISIAMGFIVPLFCLFFITWTGITLARREGMKD